MGRWRRQRRGGKNASENENTDVPIRKTSRATPILGRLVAPLGSRSRNQPEFLRMVPSRAPLGTRGHLLAPSLWRRRRRGSKSEKRQRLHRFGAPKRIPRGVARCPRRRRRRRQGGTSTG